MLQVFMAKVIR